MGKKANGEGSITKRKDGRYMGRFTYNGKRSNPVYGKSYEEVREKLCMIQASIAKGEYIEPDQGTVAAWLDNWLVLYAFPTVKQSTYIAYEGYIRNHLNPILGKTKLTHLAMSQLQEFFNTKKLGKNCKALSPKTLKNIYNMLNTSLEQAVISNKILRNPIKGVKLPQVLPQEMRVLTKDEQRSLENIAKQTPELYAFGITFTLYTGLRLGELLGLQWQDVNFQEHTIKIRRTLGRLNKVNADGVVMRGAEYGQATEIVVRSPKTLAAIREIPIIFELWNDLLNYQAKQKALFETMGDSFKNEGYIICTPLGKPCDPRVFQTYFERMVKSAGIEKANFHSLRHTFATRSLESGMDIKVLSALLGHSQASTTLNRYGHALPDHKKESMDKIRQHYNIAG